MINNEEERRSEVVSQYNPDQLKAILDKHFVWVDSGGGGGERAVLRYANLCGADLRYADLCDADLCYANLRYADLCYADLCDANLCGADLRYATLRGANLRGADLCDANLRGANLLGANLRGADLTAYQICHGKLSVWKKVSGCMVNLEIPEEAKRTASIVGRKCRAEYAKVLAIFDKDGEPVTAVHGDFDTTLIYTVGETVYPDKYDDDPRTDCTHGIHFFQTRKEAEEY